MQEKNQEQDPSGHVKKQILKEEGNQILQMPWVDQGEIWH